jgi:guanylate kinase
VTSPAPSGLVAVISGPSGVGKTTVVEGLLKLPGYARSITATTRPPRSGEKDGVDYLFLPRGEFEKGIQRGLFLEHAVVHGHLYGTPKDRVVALLKQGMVCLLNIDVQGAAALRRSGLAVRTIFILPPSMEELQARLTKRATEGPAEVAIRMEIARREIAQADGFDLKAVNRVVEETVGEIDRFLRSGR